MIWLGLDMLAMPAIEYYGRSGWYLACSGAFLVGAFMLVAWPIRGFIRSINRRSRRAT